MTIIHAFRRVKPYTHVFPDVILKFAPNDHGDVVCDVASESAVERLLKVPTGFRVYENQYGASGAEKLAQVPVAMVPSTPAGEPVKGDRAKYILVNGDTTFDLNPLDDASLRDFAKANGIKVHHAAKGDTIRDAIVEALRETEAGSGEPVAGEGPADSGAE